MPLTLESIKSNCTVDAETGCWNWSGSRQQEMGYGKFHSAGKHYLVHRLVWALVFGNPPASMCVLHKCDNPPCCNPDHLKLGTQADNIADCVSKKRNAFGERQHLSKLNPKTVLEIVRSKESGPRIAKRLGVTHGAIYCIRNGRTWCRVTGLKYAKIKR